MIDSHLPHDMHKNNTCFFTGHRAVAYTSRGTLYTNLLRCILKLHCEGMQYFLCGGAIGFDMLGGMAVLQAKQYSKDIHLVLVLPCRNQTERWVKAKKESALINLQTYQHLKDQADAIVYIGDLYYDGCMRDRNAQMTALGSHCIAYWNGSKIGGTAQTIRMAQKANIPITNLW